jgi:hypothetical protein
MLGARLLSLGRIVRRCLVAVMTISRRLWACFAIRDNIWHGMRDGNELK